MSDSPIIHGNPVGKENFGRMDFTHGESWNQENLASSPILFGIGWHKLDQERSPQRRWYCLIISTKRKYLSNKYLIGHSVWLTSWMRTLNQGE
jgi:hypothetical protein